MLYSFTPGVGFPTLGTGTLVDLVLLLEMPVESLHKGCLHFTESALPWLVLAVVSAQNILSEFLRKQTRIFEV